MVTSSLSDSYSSMPKVFGKNSVGEDRATMFSSYGGLLPKLPRWCEFPLGIYCSGDLSKGTSRGAEHDAREVIRLYREMLREDALEFSEVCAEPREATKHELKVAERVPAYKRANIGKVKRIDARDGEHLKWKAHHLSVRNTHDIALKALRNRSRPFEGSS